MIPSISDQRLALAIFTVNKHAKTAPNNQYLYALKREALQKMIDEKRANKVGLHFVQRAKHSQQNSVVVVQCADYFFHTLPTKQDMKQLSHLGSLDPQFRNPKGHMSLTEAKRLLCTYTNRPIESASPPKLRGTGYFQGY